jgi:hypothetical protein
LTCLFDLSQYGRAHGPVGERAVAISTGGILHHADVLGQRDRPGNVGQPVVLPGHYVDECGDGCGVEDEHWQVSREVLIEKLGRGAASLSP